MRLVVDRAFPELWQPMSDHDDCPANVFGEIYVGLSKYLREPEPEYVRDDDGTIRDVSVGIVARASRALSDPADAEALLAGLSAADFDLESQAVLAVGSGFDVLADVATNGLAAAYLDLLRRFVDRYSLRYYIDGQARMWITFSGLATSLFGQLRVAALAHPHLLQELNAFEHALAECLAEPAETRIKTTIQKQVNVLEAFGSQHSLVTGNTLGRMLEEVGTWPHDSIADAARSLYKFACDYPGIRHAGNYSAATRSLDLRDLAGVTFSLVGLVAYLSEGFEVEAGPAIRGESSGGDSLDPSAAPWLQPLASGGDV